MKTEGNADDLLLILRYWDIEIGRQYKLEHTNTNTKLNIMIMEKT